MMIYTMQHAFNIVWQHAKEQKRSVLVQEGDGSPCAYRGVNEAKCFVGALIDDAHYSKDIEGIAAGVLLDNGVLAFTDVSKGLAEHFLLDLQAVHDYSKIASWRDDLRDLAQRYSLEVPQ